MGGLFEANLIPSLRWMPIPIFQHILTLYFKNVGKMMQFENYRTGRIIVKFSLLSAAAGTISHLLVAPPSPICAEP